MSTVGRSFGLISALILLGACGGGSGGGAGSGSSGGTGPATSRLTFTVTATAGPGGSIGPMSVSIARGGEATFTVTPLDGYEIDAVTGCGGRLNGSIYFTGPIFVDCLVEARFREMSDLGLVLQQVQVNQGSQDTGGRIPLVAGRGGLLRAVVTANRHNEAAPPVRFSLYQDGVLQWEQDVRPERAGVPVTPDLDEESMTWNLELAPEEIRPGMSIVAVVDPYEEIPVSDRDATRFPRGSGRHALNVQAAAPMRVLFIPVRLADGTTGTITSVDELLSASRRWFPVSRLEGAVRPVPYATDRDVTRESGVEQLLGDLYAVRVMERATDEYYHGILPGIPRLAIGGIAYVPGSPSSPSRVAISADFPSFVASTVAHELGHNLGRTHSPCGDPEDVDPQFPYRDGRIGVAGFDLRDRRVLSSRSYYDFMSYCGPRWTSDHTFRKILEWRSDDPFAAAAGSMMASDPFSAERGGDPSPGLLVWGSVGPDGVRLNPVVEMEAQPFLPEAPGPHAVEGRDADGEIVFSLSFEGSRLSHGAHEEERHFAFFVPLDAHERGRLSAVTVGSPFGAAMRAHVPRALRDALGRPDGPAPTMHRRADGSMRITWDSSEHPVVVIREPASGTVLSIAQEGELVIPADVLRAQPWEMMLPDGRSGRLLP